MVDIGRFITTAGQIAQAVNFLPHKHEDLCCSSWNLNEILGMVIQAHNPNCGCEVGTEGSLRPVI